MRRTTPRFLLLALAAAVELQAGWMEEVARNTDTTVEAGFYSRSVGKGRAPDVGPIANFSADARLSVPGGLGLNVDLEVAAIRSLDGTPRLDQREVSLTIERHTEQGYLALGFGLTHQLGINPATTALIDQENAVTLTYVRSFLEGSLTLHLDAQWTPVREELHAEASLVYTQSLSPTLSWSLMPVAGSTRAGDNLGDNLGVVDSFTYIGGSIYLSMGFGDGYTVHLQGGAQARSEGPNRSVGWGGLSVSRSF